MVLVCPNCQANILPDNVNIQTDLAKCVACGTLHKASDLATVRKEVSSTPPLGSALTVERAFDGATVLSYPAKGFKPMDLFMVVFTTIWLSFVCFWTWGAAQASVIFALFSIPFWCVGFFLAYGLVNGIYETQKIVLATRTISIVRKSIFGLERTETFDFDAVMDIDYAYYRPNAFSTDTYKMTGVLAQRGGNQGWLLPSLITGSKTAHFFERANEAECLWLFAYLKQKMKK